MVFGPYAVTTYVMETVCSQKWNPSQMKNELMQTHYEGCWESPRHHECAVVKIYELLIDLAKAKDELEQIHEDFDNA